MRSTSCGAGAALFISVGIATAHAEGRMFNWNCGLRGAYSLSTDDAGSGTPGGNALPGTNRLLLSLTVGEDSKNSTFRFSAYIDNKAVLQMQPDAKQLVSFEADSKGTPRDLKVTWIDMTGTNSLVLEKSPKKWRFIHVTANVNSDDLAQSVKSTPGQSILVDVGDCVLNP